MLHCVALCATSLDLVTGQIFWLGVWYCHFVSLYEWVSLDSLPPSLPLYLPPSLFPSLSISLPLYLSPLSISLPPLSISPYLSLPSSLSLFPLSLSLSSLSVISLSLVVHVKLSEGHLARSVSCKCCQYSSQLGLVQKNLPYSGPLTTTRPPLQLLPKATHTHTHTRTHTHTHTHAHAHTHTHTTKHSLYWAASRP